MAACWNLPIVYVIENNMYAEKTSISDTCRLANVSDRALAYGIPNITVDGNDVIAVYEAVSQAVARARKGEGPTLVETKTYRWHGHYEGDPQTYKPKEEVDQWMQRDPIVAFRRKLIEMGTMMEQDTDKIAEEINEEIDRAVNFATESPFPAPEETLEDVFA
jgi:TPP-dependent pyruvate/acetoin dehydrogenase alpha subunit